MIRSRIFLAAASIAAVLFASAFTGREYLALTYLGSKTAKRTIAGQEALIAPFIHVFAPAVGNPPFPAIVQFHGCAGYRPDFMEMWAKVATDAGFLVLAVDSAGPRGLDREKSKAEVCTGKTLIGQERAGDIAAALALAAARPDVDPERLVAAGWSHGAWSLMDYLAFNARGANPPSISGAAAPVDPAGIILFYPYCGEGAWSRFTRWKTRSPILAFVGGKDTIVDAAACKAQFEKISREGANSELVYYPDADHVFDDAGLLGGEHAHYYSPPEAADATGRYRRFIGLIRDRP